MSDSSQLRIEAAHKKLSEVFSKDYAFSIPAYQRPYAWETAQVEELFTDLVEASTWGKESEQFYFLGSVVLVKNHGNPAARVIDGQQRLTTLTILLSLIRDLTQDPVRRANRESYIKQVVNHDEGIPESLRLQLRKKDQHFFEKQIQTLGATDNLPAQSGLTGSQARIIENAKTLRAKLLEMGETARDKLLIFMLQSCYLVIVDVPTDNAARRIFTVLNARGLDLSATDILKATLLERAGTPKEEALAQRWEDLETTLGRDRFSSLFTHIRMIFERDKPRSALESGFPECVPLFHKKPLEFVDQVLEPYADALTLTVDDVTLRQRFGSKTADLVRSLKRLDNRDWLPPLLVCLRQHQEGVCDDVMTVVFNLERLAYFLFLTRADVNARMARYAEVLDELDPQALSKPRAGKKARSNGFELTQVEAFALFSALDGDVYLSSKVVKPLLLRLEQASTDGSANYDFPVISVEHVCPQTIAPGSQWEQWFSDSSDHAVWVHTLANLVLLSSRKNSSAQNYDFDKKKSKYFASGDSCAFTLTNEVRAHSQWTLTELTARRWELLARLAKAWRLENNLEQWRSLE